MDVLLNVVPCFDFFSKSDCKLSLQIKHHIDVKET